MKYVFILILANLALLAGFVFFVSLWTALLYFGSLLAIGVYVARVYDRHHDAEKFFGSIDSERQRRALEAYILERKRVLESRDGELAASTARRPMRVPNGHLQCLGCGMLVKELLPITGKDLGGTDDERFMRVCAICLEWVRSAFRFESSYTLARILRDSALSIPVASASLIVLSEILAYFHIFSSDAIRITSLVASVTFFVGGAVVWERLRPRYGLTHNLTWALRSRVVNLGLSLVSASVIVALISPTVVSLLR